MSTFNYEDSGIPVTIPEGLSEEKLLNYYPFQHWITTLQKSLELQKSNECHPFRADPYTLRSVTVQAVDMFKNAKGDGRIGFLKLTSEVSNSAGETLPGAVFMRGPSVAILMILIPSDAPKDKEDRWVPLAVQPRVAAGSMEFVELPAGMVDEEGNFSGAMANEIKEELGIVIKESELTSMSELAAEAALEEKPEVGETLPRGMYPSPGACDEHIRIFLHERQVSREELKTWEGKLTGLRQEGEKIKLKLVKLQDVWKVASRDGKTLAALALYEGLKKEKKV